MAQGMGSTTYRCRGCDVLRHQYAAECAHCGTQILVPEVPPRGALEELRLAWSWLRAKLERSVG